jgi:hypothetical protein
MRFFIRLSPVADASSIGGLGILSPIYDRHFSFVLQEATQSNPTQPARHAHFPCDVVDHACVDDGGKDDQPTLI